VLRVRLRVQKCSRVADLLVQRVERASVEVGLHSVPLLLQDLLHLLHVDGGAVLVHPLPALPLVVLACMRNDGLLQLRLVDLELLAGVLVAHLHVHVDGLLQQMSILLLIVALLLDGRQDGLTRRQMEAVEDVLLVLLEALLLQTEDAVSLRRAAGAGTEWVSIGSGSVCLCLSASGCVCLYLLTLGV
jgi:hypothetical protein